MSLDINLTNVQSIPIVVNANITAENNKVYHVIANATFTDPTPVEGSGYVVLLRNGVATIGGVSNGNLGTVFYRIFRGTSWVTYLHYDLVTLQSVFVPPSRTINGLDLSANRTLTTADIADSSNKRYVTDANLTVIGNTSGTNTGDQDLTNLVVKNSAITGATKTKITYDAKGLVTAGADATTADIADSSNKRYVTDANLTVIGNTSGTNTGDQTLSGLGGVPTTRTITINGTTQDLSADRTFTVGNPFPLFGASMGNVIGAATPVTRFFAFLGLTANTAENQRQIPVPYAVTFKNFFCFFGVGASQPVSGSLVLTIRKNGVDTAITITIPAGSSIGTYSDTTNSESFAAGDLISVKAVNNAISVASGNITSLTLGTI